MDVRLERESTQKEGTAQRHDLVKNQLLKFDQQFTNPTLNFCSKMRARVATRRDFGVKCAERSAEKAPLRAMRLRDDEEGSETSEGAKSSSSVNTLVRQQSPFSSPIRSRKNNVKPNPRATRSSTPQSASQTPPVHTGFNVPSTPRRYLCLLFCSPRPMDEWKTLTKRMGKALDERLEDSYAVNLSQSRWEGASHRWRNSTQYTAAHKGPAWLFQQYTGA
jgi:hypothetical protein